MGWNYWLDYTAVEVGAWMSNKTPLQALGVITYPCFILVFINLLVCARGGGGGGGGSD